MSTVLILAKAPQVGQVKTRLCPPLTPDQASAFHGAMLRDTLTLVRSFASGRYLAYSGDRLWFDAHCPDFYLFAQQGEDLALRLHHSLDFVLRWQQPVICIGSDSPQLSLSVLQKAQVLLQRHPVVMGPALDGGYYLIGLRQFQPLFLGMPMSTPGLRAATEERCRTLGLSIGYLDTLRDLDTWEDVLDQRSQLRGHSARWLAHLQY